jgi:hypothetical protein
MRKQFKRQESWDSVIGLLMQSDDVHTEEQAKRLVEYLELDNMTLHVKSMEASVVLVKMAMRKTLPATQQNKLDVTGVRNEGMWRATRFGMRAKRWSSRAKKTLADKKSGNLLAGEEEELGSDASPRGRNRAG